MKKGIGILLLVVSMVMFMTGCGGDATNASMRPTPETDIVTETDTQQEQTLKEQLIGMLPEEPSDVSPNLTQEPEQQTVNFEFITTGLEGGHYNKPGFGDRYGVYRFEGTNVAVFTILWSDGDRGYVIGEDYGETQGPLIADYLISKGEHFLALSNQYMLFLNKDGKVAKDLREKKEERDDGTYLVHDTIPFEELSVEEQEAFVFPCSYEVVSNVEESESTK